MGWSGKSQARQHSRAASANLLKSPQFLWRRSGILWQIYEVRGGAGAKT
jgi:hypothetical protein